MRPPAVLRTPHRLEPDPRRVIAKYYEPSEELVESREPRVRRLVRRILELPEDDRAMRARGLLAEFSKRHRDYATILERHYQRVAHHVPDGVEPSTESRLLIGAYVTHEFSIQAAALLNPSMVPAPDQTGLAPGEQRFVMSLRAVGEGHISSIEFRSGVVRGASEVTLDPVSRYATLGSLQTLGYDKHLFDAKLRELGADNEIAARVLDPLGDGFTLPELEQSLELLSDDGVSPVLAYKTVEFIRWLAMSNYRVGFGDGTDLSERVVFPIGPSESQGMEDARFVRFTDDDGSTNYYATYTAFDGYKILPQLIETRDFSSFRIATLNGSCASNKGMALFPRRIDGRYAALSRYDRENIDIMFSDNVRFWNSREQLRVPVWPWELMQIGNCGSPIETEAGWLVLTHGVGPMRQYTIGVILLDLDDPRRVIADLPEPILVADEREREGYVPNVVYSCGAMLHDDTLVLPYGFSDAGVGIALAPMADLLGALLDHPVR